MGQVQRKNQQGIELLELYEEERATESGRSGRGSRRNSQRSGRDARRTRGTGAEEYGRDGVKRRAGSYGREETGRRTGGYGREEARRRADRSGHNGERKRAGRSGDVSQISCIRPYPAADRRKEPEYAYRGNARPVQSIKRRRARRRREFLCKAAIALFSVACLAMIYVLTGQIYQMVHKNTREKPLSVMTEQVSNDISSDGTGIAPPEVIQNFLEINEYSRPGDKLSKVNSIFVHYTANPGTSAAQNRSYFANLAETHERSASAHLIIGYEGELIQCIPFDEQAYAVMTRNEDSISIECCYLSDDGSFTQETYDTLIHTLAWLTDKYDLSTEDILRHYDCGGKLCPLYYAENESAWSQLRQDVEAYLAQARQESAEL